jgi:hypothetical protein
MNNQQKPNMAIICGECGGNVKMATRVTATHFIHTCPYGHIYHQPRAVTRRFTAQRNTRPPNDAA